MANSNTEPFVNEWARNQYGEIGYDGDKKARWAGLGLNGIDPPDNLMIGWTCRVKDNTSGPPTFISWDHDTGIAGKPKKVNVQVGWTYTGRRARWKFTGKVDPVTGLNIWGFMWVGMEQPEILSDPEQPWVKQTYYNGPANEKNFTLVKAGCLCKFDGDSGNNGKAQSGIYDFYTRGPFNHASPTRGCERQTWKALSNGNGGVTWERVS
jgi:hypothetical protein